MWCGMKSDIIVDMFIRNEIVYVCISMLKSERCMIPYNFERALYSLLL